MGMKILQHVLKMLKQCNGSKFQFQIQNEVQEIFRTWLMKQSKISWNPWKSIGNGTGSLQQEIFSL